MRRSLLVALLAPLLTAPACSGRSDPADAAVDRHDSVERRASPADAVRASPDRATAAGSARIEITVTFDGPAGRVDLRSSGAFDGDRATTSTDLGSVLSSLPEADVGPLPEGFDEPARTIHDGDTVYVRMPLLDPLTGTSGWLSTTAGADALEELGMIDPLRVLAILRGVTGDVREVGEADVRGVATTRYRGTVDDLTVEVWIDTDGRPRRLRLPLPDTGRELGVDRPATMVVELFGYGEPIEIPVPGAAEVTPLAEVVPG